MSIVLLNIIVLFSNTKCGKKEYRFHRSQQICLRPIGRLCLATTLLGYKFNVTQSPSLIFFCWYSILSFCLNKWLLIKYDEWLSSFFLRNKHCLQKKVTVWRGVHQVVYKPILHFTVAVVADLIGFNVAHLKNHTSWIESLYQANTKFIEKFPSLDKKLAATKDGAELQLGTEQWLSFYLSL